MKKNYLEINICLTSSSKAKKKILGSIIKNYYKLIVLSKNFIIKSY